MTEFSDLDLGRLIASVENLEKTCERLEHTVDKLEKKVEEQDLLIAKGKTAAAIGLGILGAIWTAIELFIRGS